MSAATQSRTRKGDWLLFDFALIVGIFATLGVGFLLSATHIGQANASNARAHYHASQLQTAILSYYTEYGVMPDVSKNAALIETLTSVTRTGGQPPAAFQRNNPRGIAFLSVQMRDLNDKNDLLDPWGTPYRISIEGESKVHVSSAGPDKIFGTADDITNQ